MILYQLNHNLIITIITEKVTIKRVMQIHNIMVLIFSSPEPKAHKVSL